MKPRTRRTLHFVLIVVLVGLIGCLNYYIWFPDIVRGQTTLLASAESQSGDQFKVVQFWGPDFYTTQLEHIGPDGTTNVAMIDWDDTKQWSCSISLIEGEKKLVISFSSERQVFEYRWDLGYFVLPAGREEFPYAHRAKRYP